MKSQPLLVGAILSPGKRTVTSALRVMGLEDDRNFARYHHVLSRAVWQPLQLGLTLLWLLLQHLYQGDGPLVFGIEETLRRRRGGRIKAIGETPSRRAHFVNLIACPASKLEAQETARAIKRAIENTTHVDAWTRVKIGN